MVSQEEIKQMEKLRQITEGVNFDAAAESVVNTGATTLEGFGASKPATRASGEEIDAMAKILKATQKFSGEVEQPQTLTESSSPSNGSTLRQERSNYGWGIKSVLNENTGRVKSYTVFHEGLDTIIADNIKLIEAANKIMQLLNDGVTINDKRMSKVLFLEHEYKDHAVKTKKLKTINESKSNQSRLRCLQIKKEIANI